MPERGEFEALFLEHLSWVDRVSASLCRRYGLNTDSAGDFGSWVHARLVEDDYAVFRKFRGESAITTYLTVVIAMLFREYRVQRWGRWRPSAAAKRHGPIAVRLESLVYRDGMRVAQAVQLLHTAGETDLTERELAVILAQLPARSGPRPVDLGPEPLADAPARSRADDLVLEHEAVARQHITERALSDAIERLPSEERVIIRMRFWEGLSVADIARALHLEQKPLYRRIERALAEVRRRLEAAGVSREYAQEILTDRVV